MTKTCRGCGREFSGGETFCPVDGSRLSSPSQARDLTSGADPLVGVTLGGRYRILRAIGEGGMGVVYEAEHVLIEKRVALKVLRDAFTRRPDVVERFRQEAKSASRIGHPNIVDVSDFGETPSGASYIVLEMLQGEDLADILTRECALAPTRAVLIAYQVAKALGAAHKKGIVHRDLKPENVYLIAREGQPDFVKVVDFGVAKMSDIDSLNGRKLTRTGMIFGTPEYMSPEHAGGKELDSRVDIYALGIIMYELLTGRVPFEGDNFMEVLARHSHDPVPAMRTTNPGTRVSDELNHVVMRALEKDPERRYQSMDELMADLRKVAEMPSIMPHESIVPPEWALSAPPRSQTSAAPIEGAVRKTSAPGFLLPDRRRFWWASAALLIVGVVWFVMARGDDPAHDGATAGAPAVNAPMIAKRPTMAASAALAGAPPSAAAVTVPAAELPARVEVHIRTEPSGARITVDGLGRVCDATPCTTQLPRATAITLRATRGKAVATRSFSLDEATDVDLRLALPAPRKKVAAVSPRVVAAPLQVPEIFR